MGTRPSLPATWVPGRAAIVEGVRGLFFDSLTVHRNAHSVPASGIKSIAQSVVGILRGNCYDFSGDLDLSALGMIPGQDIEAHVEYETTIRLEEGDVIQSARLAAQFYTVRAIEVLRDLDGAPLLRRAFCTLRR